jgi:hypothetical protein
MQKGIKMENMLTELKWLCAVLFVLALVIVSMEVVKFFSSQIILPASFCLPETGPKTLWCVLKATM